VRRVARRGSVPSAVRKPYPIARLLWIMPRHVRGLSEETYPAEHRYAAECSILPDSCYLIRGELPRWFSVSKPVDVARLLVIIAKLRREEKWRNSDCRRCRGYYFRPFDPTHVSAVSRSAFLLGRPATHIDILAESLLVDRFRDGPRIGAPSARDGWRGCASAVPGH